MPDYDMYDEPLEEMSNQQKAAILFITLGPELSAPVFKHLSDDEIERITLEIASQKQVTPAQKAYVISEFYQLAMAQDYLSSGGLEYAQDVLEKMDPRGCAFIWDGASIPMVTSLVQASGAAPLIVGWGQSEDRIHSPNESYSCAQFDKAREWGRKILENLF